MLKAKMKVMLGSAMSVLGMGGFALAGRCATPTVESVVASSTSAIGDAGSTVFGVFFGILPTILLFVVPITLVLWGIFWILGHFKRGKKH